MKHEQEQLRTELMEIIEKQREELNRRRQVHISQYLSVFLMYMYHPAAYLSIFLKWILGKKRTKFDALHYIFSIWYMMPICGNIVSASYYFYDLAKRG